MPVRVRVSNFFFSPISISRSYDNFWEQCNPDVQNAGKKGGLKFRSTKASATPCTFHAHQHLLEHTDNSTCFFSVPQQPEGTERSCAIKKFSTRNSDSVRLYANEDFLWLMVERNSADCPSRPTYAGTKRDGMRTHSTVALQ